MHVGNDHAFSNPEKFSQKNAPRAIPQYTDRFLARYHRASSAIDAAVGEQRGGPQDERHANTGGVATLKRKRERRERGEKRETGVDRAHYDGCTDSAGMDEGGCCHLMVCCVVSLVGVWFEFFGTLRQQQT
jgi:hypothetical protein